MSTDSTLTSKGQTTIPKDIRETLGMKSGDRMTFTMLPDGTVLMRVKNKSVMSLAGSLRKIPPGHEAPRPFNTKARARVAPRFAVLASLSRHPVSGGSRTDDWKSSSDSRPTARRSR